MQRPRWGQIREFCRKQRYRETRTDHYHYVKVLQDRSVSRTMVSFGADGLVVPAQLWAQIWRHQLKLVSEEEFWKGLNGEEVRYAAPPPLQPPQPLPPYLLTFLRDRLHLFDEQIARTSRDEAQNLLNRYYSDETRPE